MRIVTKYRALLFLVQRLDRRVAVYDPRQAQERFITAPRVLSKPRDAGSFIHLFKTPAHRVFTYHRRHTEECRIDVVAPDACHVGIAIMAGKNG